MADILSGGKLTFKDKDGNSGVVASLNDNDIATLNQALEVLYGLFPVYSTDDNYAVGQFRIYANELYKCVQANGPSTTVVTPGTNTAYWVKVITSADLANYLPLSGGTMTGDIVLPITGQTTTARAMGVVSHTKYTFNPSFSASKVDTLFVTKYSTGLMVIEGVCWIQRAANAVLGYELLTLPETMKTMHACHVTEWANWSSAPSAANTAIPYVTGAGWDFDGTQSKNTNVTTVYIMCASKDSSTSSSVGTRGVFVRVFGRWDA